jgi:hypothetical protein
VIVVAVAQLKSSQCQTATPGWMFMHEVLVAQVAHRPCSGFAVVDFRPRGPRLSGFADLFSIGSRIVELSQK